MRRNLINLSEEEYDPFVEELARRQKFNTKEELFAALGYVLFRKRKTTDNTPLVNYDIEDDIDFINELD